MLLSGHCIEIPKKALFNGLQQLHGENSLCYQNIKIKHKNKIVPKNLWTVYHRRILRSPAQVWKQKHWRWYLRKVSQCLCGFHQTLQGTGYYSVRIWSHVRELLGKLPHHLTSSRCVWSVNVQMYMCYQVHTLTSYNMFSSIWGHAPQRRL